MPPTVPSKPKSLTKKKTRSSQIKVEEDDLEDWKKAKQLLKPKDQLELSDPELKEIFEKVLTTGNSQTPDNLVEFNYALGIFQPLPPPGNLLVVYKVQGTALHRDSEEAAQQFLEQGIDPETYDFSETSSIHEVLEEEPEEKEEEVKEEADEDQKDEEPKEQTEEEKEDEETKKQEEEPDEEGEVEVPEVKKQSIKPATKGGRAKKLPNQFNFCERAALTYNNPTRGLETQTIPPPMATFSSNVLQWVIYDAYLQDFEAHQLEKELERERKEKDKAPVSKQQVGKKTKGKSQLSEAVQGRVRECWKVLERMLNQNTYNDIARDYRYWDDPSDEFREEEGTLLPLWKFTLEKTKKNTVTDMMWNPYYYDFFAVCFGYLEYMKPIADGAVCLFTLKNPSYPDYICLTDSAVMCVDIHKMYPYMIVIGLYNGTVQVYNIQNSCKVPAYTSNNILNKHKGIVWEVKWALNLPDGELNFYSASTDSKINNWVLMQSELSVTTILSLTSTLNAMPGPDGTLFKVKGAACCITLHPTDPLIYLVGTERGRIYKCSTAYSSMYLLSYKAHEMRVCRIDYNKFNTDIFISCSGDWRIKIWEDNRLSPLFVFDVGDRVGDIKWAPYSSTVFAAVTSLGKVHVFDLNINKYKAIAEQSIVPKRKNKLTRISFNHKLPIIIVGDDKGCVTSLKLSPNLRIPCKAPKKQQNLDQWTMQCMKLDKLLSLVREPIHLTLPEDTAGSEEDA